MSSHTTSHITPARCLALTAVALLLPLLALVPGCGDTTGGAAASGDPADATPRPGGEVTIAIQADGSTLDPHKAADAGSMRLIENMYSTLMRYSPTYGEVEPDLLAAHEVSDDFQTFTLTIRDDATFHSGRPVTAEDVRFSLQRIADGTLRSEPFADLEAIEVQDEHTVVLRFASPMSPLLTYLAHPMMAIVDREVVQANDGDLSRADAGSGPFKLVEWQKDRRLVLERHDEDHVPDRPRLDRVIDRPIPEETARTTALVNREVDVVLDVPVQDVSMLETQGHLTVDSVPGTFWEYVGMNTQREPFNEPAVRQAVAWAIDRQVINEGVKYGRATVLPGGHIPPHHWANADLYIYPRRDVSRARQLLADAGYADGFETELIVGADFPYQVQAAGLVKQMLGDVGIDVTLRRLESTMFFSRLGQRDFDMTLVGWVGFVDPDEWCYTIFHSEGKYNQQGYANAEIDQLLAHGRAIGDRDQRRTVYEQVQQRIANDAPMAFLYCNDQTSAYLNEVRDFDVHATATTISQRDAWLAR